MTWALIPAKSFPMAKGRLSGCLEASQRARLARALLARTVTIVRRALPGQPVWVVAMDADVAMAALAAGADHALVARAGGLNAQLAEAAACIPASRDILVIHTDLPRLSVDAVAALVAEPGDMVIGCDTRGEGTNALVQRNGQRSFLFGPGSCAAHASSARRRGIEPKVVKMDELAFDLDCPGDWRELGGSFEQVIACLEGERLMTATRMRFDNRGLTAPDAPIGSGFGNYR